MEQNIQVSQSVPPQIRGIVRAVELRSRAVGSSSSTTSTAWGPTQSSDSYTYSTLYTEDILVFRIETDSEGRAIPVEIRGNIRGQLKDGDEVEAVAWLVDGTIHTNRVWNLSTRAWVGNPSTIPHGRTTSSGIGRTTLMLITLAIGIITGLVTVIAFTLAVIAWFWAFVAWLFLGQSQYVSYALDVTSRAIPFIVIGIVIGLPCFMLLLRVDEA